MKSVCVVAVYTICSYVDAAVVLARHVLSLGVCRAV